jgi:putative transposase
MTKLNLQKDILNSDNFESDLINSIKLGKPLIGNDGVITKLLKNVLEKALSAELDNHLLCQNSSDRTNRKNGYGSKVVKSDFGKFEIDTPRDRDSSFNPEILPKGQTVISEALDNHILKLYSSGMGYEDICSTIKEIYGYETSNSFISKVTDKIIPEIDQWRNRELDTLYPIVFLDAMHFKGKDSKEERVKTKVLYNIMGINNEGFKEILGFYISDNGEGKHFWLNVLNDLKNRGVEDILISCIDGLKGFPEAINSIFPQCEVQLCIVHQIRNSLKYVASKYQKEFMQDLKKIYKASNLELAENALIELDQKWGKKYPVVISSWQNN